MNTEKWQMRKEEDVEEENLEKGKKAGKIHLSGQ